MGFPISKWQSGMSFAKPRAQRRWRQFNDERGKTVGLADLFGEHDTLVTYFWMFGPQRERPCPMCTSVLGAIDNGSEWPALDVWVKRDGAVRHFWGSELGGTSDPGEDPRGAPDPTPLWNILDPTPGGRGTDWYPKLEYPNAA